MVWPLQLLKRSSVLPLCAATGAALCATRSASSCSGADADAAAGSGASAHAHSYSDGHQRLAPRMLIGDPDGFARKMKKFARDGPEQLLVIADFDRTLTPYYKPRRGPKAPLEQESSSHGLLMTSSVLHPQVCVGEQELFARFYPVEVSPTLSEAEKLPFMEQWWNNAHALLIEYALTKAQVKEAVELGGLTFRPGFHSLLKLLETQEVPTLVFSAGLYDVIHAALEKEFKAERKRNGDGSSGVQEQQTYTPGNVHVVSNMMRFDAQGRLQGFGGTVIHSLNKSARVLLDSPFWKTGQLEKRRNVLLLGDSRGDVRMADGLKADEIIRVGFLNVHVEEALEEYLELYDVVLTHDASLASVEMLIEQVAAASTKEEKH